MPPDFFGGVAQDRREPAHHRFEDVPDGGLRAAAGDVVGSDGVLAVFDDVEVETAHVHRTEVKELLVDEVELVVLVGGDDVVVQFVGAGEGIAVQCQQLFERHGVARGVEIVQVGEQEAAGVADAAVGIGALFEDVVR